MLEELEYRRIGRHGKHLHYVGLQIQGKKRKEKRISYLEKNWQIPKSF